MKASRIGFKNYGFTLIELMVVIAVLSIFLTVGIPSFTQAIKNNRLSAASNDLVSLLQFARSESVRRGENIVVTANNGTGANEWGGGAVVANDEGDELRIMNNVDTDITLDGQNGDVTITFSRTGFTDLTATETIEICDDRSGEQGWQISVLVSGIIDIRRMACS